MMERRLSWVFERLIASSDVASKIWANDSAPVHRLVVARVVHRDSRVRGEGSTADGTPLSENSCGSKK